MTRVLIVDDDGSQTYETMHAASLQATTPPARLRR